MVVVFLIAIILFLHRLFPFVSSFQNLHSLPTTAAEASPHSLLPPPYLRRTLPHPPSSSQFERVRVEGSGKPSSAQQQTLVTEQKRNEFTPDAVSGSILMVTDQQLLTASVYA